MGRGERRRAAGVAGEDKGKKRERRPARRGSEREREKENEAGEKRAETREGAEERAVEGREERRRASARERGARARASETPQRVHARARSDRVRRPSLLQVSRLCTQHSSAPGARTVRETVQTSR